MNPDKKIENQILQSVRSWGISINILADKMPMNRSTFKQKLNQHLNVYHFTDAEEARLVDIFHELATDVDVFLAKENNSTFEKIFNKWGLKKSILSKKINMDENTFRNKLNSNQPKYKFFEDEIYLLFKVLHELATDIKKHIQKHNMNKNIFDDASKYMGEIMHKAPRFMFSVNAVAKELYIVCTSPLALIWVKQTLPAKLFIIEGEQDEKMLLDCAAWYRKNAVQKPQIN